VLADGSKNVVKGFNSTMPGIYVPQGSRLIIQGTTGSLDVSSNGNGCGIGGSNAIDAGDIEIQGGVITATGGDDCAGIGSGNGSYVGDILISGGTIIANGDSSGYYAGIGGAASIGVGWEGHYGNITIKKTVTSVTAKDGVGLSPTGRGDLGTVTIEEGANVIQN